MSMGIDDLEIAYFRKKNKRILKLCNGGLIVIFFDIAEWVISFFFLGLGTLLFSLSFLITFHVLLQIIDRLKYEG
tara:strand:- start:542 stop:766 length:225 start_codon:yes stop_codon:yes gene_type:complete